MKVRCDECGGHGVIAIAVDTGTVGTGYFREEVCPECDGDAEVDVLCPCCSEPVDDYGFCASCREPLTEVHGDPLLKRRAA